ncbi:hypothetical protein HanRHA438_Chr09g0415771 [Helianthus annuus]|nr:hypothetical protein HanIR_Chr09g0435301 [Helianthus annuus]KAJ0889706.1 hypothetical protein HanRHA438_Chr09g0415771 [Helianthus annuus]
MIFMISYSMHIHDVTQSHLTYRQQCNLPQKPMNNNHFTLLQVSWSRGKVGISCIVSNFPVSKSKRGKSALQFCYCSWRWLLQL